MFSKKIRRERQRVIEKVGLMVIGDSIPAAGASDRSSFIEKLCLMSEQRHRFRKSFAVGGKTVQEVFNEQWGFVCQQRPLPAKLAICCGSNNLNSLQELKDGWDALLKIIALADARGIEVWLWYIPARGAQQQNRERWELWNAKISELKFRRSLKALNGHAALVDPATGINIAGTCADLDHPEVWGRALVAQYGINDPAMSGGHVDGPLHLAFANEDSTNFLSNACFTAGGGNLAGGATGTVVNGATGTGAVFSLIPGEGNVKGNWQRLMKPAGMSAVAKLEIPANRPVTPGHVMEFNGRIRQHGAANAPDIFNSGIQYYWADGQFNKISDEFVVGKAGIADEIGIFHYRTQVPNGASNVVVVVGDSYNNVPTVDSYVDVAQLYLADITAIENA